MPRKTKADLRMWRKFLRYLVLRDEFREGIKEIRRNHKIPPDGYSATSEEVPHPSWKKMRIKTLEEQGGVLFNPFIDEDITIDLARDLKVFEARYGLFFPLQIDPFLFYVFYDQLPAHPILDADASTDDSFTLNSVFVERPSALVEAVISADQAQRAFILQQQRNKELVFPLSLRISAFASSRDLRDYIERNWKTLIKPNLEDALKKLGLRNAPKKRGQSNILVDLFVQANKKERPSLIKKVLQRQFGVLKTLSDIKTMKAKKINKIR